MGLALCQPSWKFGMMVMTTVMMIMTKVMMMVVMDDGGDGDDTEGDGGDGADRDGGDEDEDDNDGGNDNNLSRALAVDLATLLSTLHTWSHFILTSSA